MSNGRPMIEIAPTTSGSDASIERKIRDELTNAIVENRPPKITTKLQAGAEWKGEHAYALLAIEVGTETLIAKGKLALGDDGKVKVDLSSTLSLKIDDDTIFRVGPQASFDQSKDALSLGINMGVQLNRQWTMSAQGMRNMSDGQLQGSLVLEFKV